MATATDATIHSIYTLGALGAWFAWAWLLLGSAMLPNGTGWALGLLYVCARLAGKLVARLSKRLPPLLGMLLVGLLLGNVPRVLDSEVPLLGETFEWWSRQLRNGALAVIMLRAGLGIDLDKLRKLGCSTARLAMLPCLAEALTIMGLSGPLLSLPPVWGGTLGFVIAAVSPAVVVPGMLDLQARGFGTAKGIPTMVLAAASFDDVLAIAGFGVCLALAAGTEPSGDGTTLAGANSTPSDDELPVAWLAAKPLVEILAGVRRGLMACDGARPSCLLASAVARVTMSSAFPHRRRLWRAVRRPRRIGTE